jgi:hypothetical protein
MTTGDRPGSQPPRDEGTGPGARPAGRDRGTSYDTRASSRQSAFADREARRRSAFEARERRRRTTYDSCEGTRQTFVATGEFYRTLGAAIANSFEAFNRELDSDQVETTGLTRSTLDALAEGNAEFFESLADSSRRVFDELRPVVDQDTRARRSQEPIDYELLAKMVADELQKRSATAT